jgi:hypothetical protein
MNEKLDWMLGMTQNMMNMAEKNMSKMGMTDMYSMTSVMMGNLNHMKLSGDMMGNNVVDMMEKMMRGMEGMMMNMDMGNAMQMTMMKNMMNFMIMMQMSTIMGMMNPK